MDKLLTREDMFYELLRLNSLRQWDQTDALRGHLIPFTPSELKVLDALADAQQAFDDIKDDLQ